MGVVKIVVTVVLLAVILHAGDQVTSSPVAGDKNQAAALSESITSFGDSLYRQLTSGNLDNLVFSPLNTFGALAMTLLDADNNTKQEIMSVLSVQQQQQQDVHNSMKNVLDSLATGPDPDTGLTLRVASDVYYNQSQSTLSPEYSQTIQSLYGQAPNPLKEWNPEAAINSRVAQVTDGLIPKVLQPGDIADSDNIFFFKGRWDRRFQARSTRKSDFTTATGNVVRVPMMHQLSPSTRVTRIDDLNAQVIEIPYEDNLNTQMLALPNKENRASLFVIMPDTWDGFSKLEKGLDAETFDNIANNMPPPIEADLSLPKFSLRTRQTLNEPLKTMGLQSASLTTPDKQRRSTNSNKRRKVILESIIQVDEDGTKAAAVTVVADGPDTAASNSFTNVAETGTRAADTAGDQAAPAMAPITHLTVNKPFIFIARDGVSNLNIFQGRLVDPTQKRP